jgi:hypothetical protein
LFRFSNDLTRKVTKAPRGNARGEAAFDISHEDTKVLRDGGALRSIFVSSCEPKGGSERLRRQARHLAP